MQLQTLTIICSFPTVYNYIGVL